MKTLSILSAALCTLTLLSSVAYAQINQHTPDGYWLTQNGRAVIQINQCDKNPEKTCGWIYWLIEDGLKHDIHNPKEELRTRPMCGLELIKNFKQHNEKFWVDGTIYKADDGDTYKATMQIIPPNRLEVRGYVAVPLFGKSQMWSRVDPADYVPCTPAPPEAATVEEEEDKAEKE